MEQQVGNAQGKEYVEGLGYEEAVRLAFDRMQQGGLETIWSGTESSIPRKSLAPTIQIHEGMISETRRVDVQVSADKVFRTVCSLGGNTGWLYANWTWRLRAFIDRMLGEFPIKRTRLARGIPVGSDLEYIDEVTLLRALEGRVEL